MDSPVVRAEEDRIVIEIPIDYLIETQTDNYISPFAILDRNKMKAWLVENLINISEDDTVDGNLFRQFLDDVFVEAYASQSWIEGLNSKDE